MLDYMLMPRPDLIIHCLDSLFKRQCLCFLFTLTNKVYIYLSLGSCHSCIESCVSVPNGSLLSRFKSCIKRQCLCLLFITNNIHIHLGLHVAPIKILTWFSSVLNLVSLSVSSAYVWYIASLQVTCLHLKSKQGLTPPCSSPFGWPS